MKMSTPFDIRWGKSVRRRREGREMRGNGAQKVENELKESGNFMMRTSEVKIKYPEQGATNPCGVFQQPANRDRPFGVSVFDVTGEMRYLGTLPEGRYHFPLSWLEYVATPGRHTLMLAAGLAVHRIDWLNVDFIEIDVQPGGINHVVLSRYGSLSLPYLGEVQISDANRKYCERLTGTRLEREKSAISYMAANGIDSHAKDFMRFCLVLSDPKRIVSHTDEASRQFEEYKPQLEKLRVQRHEKWKREMEKRAPYDLMRSYQPVEAGVVN